MRICELGDGDGGLAGQQEQEEEVEASGGGEVVHLKAKRALVGAGARVLFYPTLLYNVLRNRFESDFRWWDRVDKVLAVPCCCLRGVYSYSDGVIGSALLCLRVVVWLLICSCEINTPTVGLSCLGSWVCFKTFFLRNFFIYVFAFGFTLSANRCTKSLVLRDWLCLSNLFNQAKAIP